MLFTLLQTGAEVAAPVAQEMHFSLIGMASKGGWIMIVLLILSIIAIYIFGQKYWMIRKASKLDTNFMKDIHVDMQSGHIDAALTRCNENDSPVARLIEKGIARIGRPLPDIQAAVENTGNIEVAKLEKSLPLLATIAGGAPMIGFLGTVIGMIEAFFNMSTAGNNIDISLLSGGIYTAMITTVGGLFVGIIAYFGYNYLTAKISNLVDTMEDTTMEFMNMLYEPQKK
ncbi:MAG: MotA/TolQ/ExbB proton channel family protein [Bacteroidales bacterium]